MFSRCAAAFVSLPLLAVLACHVDLCSDRQNSQRASQFFGLVGDLGLVAACWLLASGAAVTRTEPSLGLPLFLRYVRQLPEILYIWAGVFCIAGLYRPRRHRSHLLEVLVTTIASIGAGSVALVALRFTYHYHSRRALLRFWLIFWLAATVLVVLSRTVLEPAKERIGCRLASSLRGLRLPRMGGSSVDRRVRHLASTMMPRISWLSRPSRTTVVLWGIAVLTLNLLWYGSYLSFPLFGEDGAANYSFLVETVQSSRPWQPTFPLEGMGQPNLFVTVTFDPFSWLMLTPLPAADAFRLSYALRATVCWLTSYLFLGLLFGRARPIALTGAFISMLVSFTLTHPWGIPTFAGISVATLAAVFPGLLWLYLKLVREPRLVGWGDVVFVPALTLFLLMYPVGSLLGLAALFAFGIGLVVASRQAGRRTAGRALAKLCLFTELILLKPGLGLQHVWWLVAALSARNVFAWELTTYSRDYLAPHLWHDVPLGVRLVVVLAISPVLLGSRWSRPIRIIATTLTIIVGGTQLATIARALGTAPGLFDRLPRPFYLEFYLPVFYAAAAAYALARAGRIVTPAARSIRWWSARVAAFGAGLWALVGGMAAVLVVVACGCMESPRVIFGERRVPETAVRLLPAAAVILLFAGAGMTWLVWPQAIHPLFFSQFACRDRVLWCRVPAGRTMGADDNPVVDFLRTRLGGDGEFRGRADFLLVPGLRFDHFPIAPGTTLTAAEFELVRGWYARAYAHWSAVDPLGLFERAPRDFGYGKSGALLSTMEELAKQGDPMIGVLPDDVIVDIVEWAKRHPDRTRPIRFVSGWGLASEVTIMVEERNRNFLETGNGFLLRALPLQGIPVASSYEQALDYLYYLFWTRYVNEGSPARRSINFTTLEAVWPHRLALAGVRFVVTRDIPYTAPPPLRRVFGWKGYSVYEIADPNTHGYFPTRILFARSLEDELLTMRGPDFDPRQTAVLADSDASRVDDGGVLAPARSSRLRLSGQALVFEAESERGRSLAVLPFKFSHCWRPLWEGRLGRLVRADGALLGVVFDGVVRLRLLWAAGYGPRAGCMAKDTALVPEARKAGHALQ
jgi:hypothetical protein